MGAGFRFGICTATDGLGSSTLGGDSLLSWATAAMSVSVALLIVLESVGIESLLVSRWRPRRPSFSTVTKLALTRERGRGESEAGNESEVSMARTSTREAILGRAYAV